MTFAATSNPESTVLTPPEDLLELHIQPEGDESQTIRIDAAKCLVGSDPRCDLQLTGHAIEAVHCLLIQGAEATICRRLAPDARVNGAPFDDAVLRTGDVVQLGTAVIEVTGGATTHANTIWPWLDTESNREASSPPDSRGADHRGEGRARELEDALATSEAEREQLASAIESSQERCDELQRQN